MARISPVDTLGTDGAVVTVVSGVLVVTVTFADVVCEGFAVTPVVLVGWVSVCVVCVPVTVTDSVGAVPLAVGVAEEAVP